MKVYNVNIYSIDHTFQPGYLKHKGHGIVKVNIFGAREIATNTRLKICYDDNLSRNVDFSKYEKNGYLLGIRKKELKRKNLVSPAEVCEYLNSFSTSELKKYFDKNKIFPKEEYEKVNQIVKSIKIK